MGNFLDRFWSKTEERNGCVVWTAATNGKGYGRFYLGKPQGQKAFGYAHIIGHMLLKGPVPKGFEIDHTCHDPDVCKLNDDCPHRGCVIHTDAVPRFENVRRQMRETCPVGHPYNREYNGKRVCGVCNTENARKRRSTPEGRAAYAEYMRNYRVTKSLPGSGLGRMPTAGPS